MKRKIIDIHGHLGNINFVPSNFAFVDRVLKKVPMAPGTIRSIE